MHANLPMEPVSKYLSVILSAEYMFVNGVPFFNTYSRNIRFFTSRQQVPNIDLRIQSMKSIKDYYLKRGFKIFKLRSDQQFELTQAALSDMHIELNASVRNEHVPEVERLNRNMKERIRSVYTELILVYGRVPGVLVCELVYAVTFCLNSLRVKYGVSATLRPRAMITV